MTHPSVATSPAGLGHGTALRRRLVLVVAALTLGCDGVFVGPPQYASVSVATTTPDGQAVADVPVTLYTGARPMEYARTDARGRYIFERVPPGPFNYGVAAKIPPAFSDSGEAAYVTQDGLDVIAGSVEPVRFILRPCEGAIIVTVHDDKAQPAAGIAVRVYRSDASVDTALTGSDGAHSFTPLPCSEYGVQVMPALGLVLTNARGSSYVDAIHVHRDNQLRVALTVGRCVGTVSIIVRDAAGAGVGGTEAVVYAPTGNITSGQTSADGRRSFAQLPCGTDLGVGIKPPSGYTVATGRGSSFIDGIRFAADGDVVNIAFTVTKL